MSSRRRRSRRNARTLAFAALRAAGLGPTWTPSPGCTPLGTSSLCTTVPAGESNAWPGRTGLVHQAVLADFRDLSGYQVYACGAPAMIDAAKRDFTTLRNLPAEEFYADSFTYGAQTEAAD